MKKSLALVVPCYNEQEVLPLFYEEVGKVLKKLSAGFLTELVFVNDGSADGTLGILKDLAEKDPTVKYISFSRNFGKEAAMLAGMEYAVKSDYIGIIDADLQHSPELITEMLYYVDQEGFDVAAARREDRAGEAKLKSALSGGFLPSGASISQYPTWLLHSSCAFSRASASAFSAKARSVTPRAFASRATRAR